MADFYSLYPWARAVIRGGGGLTRFTEKHSKVVQCEVVIMMHGTHDQVALVSGCAPLLEDGNKRLERKRARSLSSPLIASPAHARPRGPSSPQAWMKELGRQTDQFAERDDVYEKQDLQKVELETELVVAKKKGQALETMNEGLKKTLEELQLQLEETRGKHDHAEAQNKEFNEELKEANEMCKKYEAEAEALKKKLAETETKKALSPNSQPCYPALPSTVTASELKTREMEVLAREQRMHEAEAKASRGLQMLYQGCAGNVLQGAAMIKDAARL
eukprot:140616-Rhodomonas_salina.1